VSNAVLEAIRTRRVARALTAAPVELGAVIARRLGLTGAIGTVAEIHDGIAVIGGLLRR